LRISVWGLQSGRAELGMTIAERIVRENGGRLEIMTPENAADGSEAGVDEGAEIAICIAVPRGEP